MGSSILQALDTYKVRGWYTKAVAELVTQIKAANQTKSEIGGGGSLADGATTTTAILLSYDAITVTLLGLEMANVAALVTTDVLAAAASVGAAIYADGSAYTGDAITLASDDTAYVTLVVTNSDGAAGAAGDDGAPLLVAVLAGTSAATAIAATGHLSSAQISAALAASAGVHAGATAWAHYAQVLWNNPSGVPDSIPTLNRNNVVAGA
jgi:hypothetical protein